ncbi:hypothetical protein [Tenggerimyces flavus]|uniref:Uncharacterized protein n=1 Tax=Tenggerimyces flavus TaxID=1708749 RepID=A0ABV7Y8C3_9ACTN|nr:hypothetical protein [Tenggerimyces flavus]MBM7785521.1 hypothetical protein [Tenggerimyces flavus]
MITADGREAEIATPPATLAPGFTNRLSDWLARGRNELDATLGADFLVDGGSTHVNVEVADRRATSIAKRFVARHSLAMMLLLDRKHSPGLLVRPRRGRLELGGEYVTGPQLVAATVFAAAAVMDCQRVGRRSTYGRFVVEPARERFGYYVDRRAFGGDLYATGRATIIGRRTAQWNLQRSWEIVRRDAATFATDTELATTDTVVRGDHPLPCERPDIDDANHGTFTSWGADLTADRRRLAFSLVAVLATWEQVVFELTHRERTWLLAVPAERASKLVSLFAGGQLDELLRRIVATPDTAFSPLLAAEQVGRGGVFGSLGNDTTLQPLERMPGTGLIGGNGAGGREDKHRTEEPRNPRPKPKPTRSWMRWAVPATAAGVVAAVLVTTYALWPRGDGNQLAAAPPPAAPTSAPTLAPTDAATARPITAADLSGTFAFTRTVVDGNEDNPVGTSSNFTATLTVECDGANCTVTFPGLGTSSLVGGKLRYQGTVPGACPSNPSIKVPYPYDTKLVVIRDKSGKVTSITGTQDLTAEVTNCPNSELDPIRTEWVGTRS